MQWECLLIELSDRTSPSGLPLTHTRPVWQLLLFKPNHHSERVSHSADNSKSGGACGKTETGEILQEKDLPGWVTSIYWCETHDFSVISTRSLEKISDQHATKKNLYDLRVFLHYDSSFSFQNGFFHYTDWHIFVLVRSLSCKRLFIYFIQQWLHLVNES